MAITAREVVCKCWGCGREQACYALKPGFKPDGAFGDGETLEVPMCDRCWKEAAHVLRISGYNDESSRNHTATG